MAAAILAAGRARWPSFRVDLAAVALHVSQVPLAETALTNAADIYLACACLRGDLRALSELDRLLQANVSTFVRRVDRTPGFVQQVSQRLRERLLLGPPPRLGAFTGAGPLLGWLRVVAVRIALDIKREHSGRLEGVDDRLRDQIAAQHAAPERQLFTGRYREAMGEALKLAIARLTAQQKQVLRLSFVAGLNIDEIGKICAVHRSTAARWIAAAEKVLLDAVKTRLRSEHGLTNSEVASLARALHSRMDLSLTQFL